MPTQRSAVGIRLQRLVRYHSLPPQPYRRSMNSSIWLASDTHKTRSRCTEWFRESIVLRSDGSAIEIQRLVGKLEIGKTRCWRTNSAGMQANKSGVKLTDLRSISSAPKCSAHGFIANDPSSATAATRRADCNCDG